jgi:hypothetical protein
MFWTPIVARDVALWLGLSSDVLPHCVRRLTALGRLVTLGQVGSHLSFLIRSVSLVGSLRRPSLSSVPNPQCLAADASADIKLAQAHPRSATTRPWPPAAGPPVSTPCHWTTDGVLSSCVELLSTVSHRLAWRGPRSRPAETAEEGDAGEAIRWRGRYLGDGWLDLRSEPHGSTSLSL